VHELEQTVNNNKCNFSKLK